MIDKNVWTMIENLPQDKKTIDLKWVFKLKNDSRFKERLVALGYKQIMGIDYNEAFEPVLVDITFRSLILFSISKNQKIILVDSERDFLEAKLQEEIYIKLPDGLKKIQAIQNYKYGNLNKANMVWFKHPYTGLKIEILCHFRTENKRNGQFQKCKKYSFRQVF